MPKYLKNVKYASVVGALVKDSHGATVRTAVSEVGSACLSQEV